MNRTFKVVFNRARAGLMVANEITSSVQKKGTKTVVAVAALGLMAMFAQANASGYADAIWDKSSEIPTNSYSGVFENKDDWFAALCAKDGASGDLSNLTIKKTGDSAQQLFGLAVFDKANFNLTGESVTINLSTGGLGGGDNALAGIYTQVNNNSNDSNTKVGISAKNVSVETTSTHSNGKSVYGVASYGGEVSFTGESVTLTTSTSTERKASDNQYSETAGLLVGTYGTNYGAGKVTFSDRTELNVNVESKSSKPTVVTDDKTSDRSGGSPAFGIKVDGGTLEAKGSTTLTVKSNGANATGLQLSAKNYQSSTDTHEFSSTATIHNLTAYAASETGSAYGVRVQSTSGQDVKLNLSGDVSVSANASGAYKARAIQASDGGQISINAGKVKAESSSIGIIALGKDAGTKIDIKAKELTVNADYGIWLQNNTETSTDKEKATAVTVNADKTVITGKESGLLAFSSSCLTINSDLAVTATKVMDVRGNSTVNINQDGKKSTVLKGDVVFETPYAPGDSQNSGKLINAFVNVNLTGKASSWEGRSYQAYRIEDGTDENGKTKYKDQQSVGLKDDASYHGNVTGFNLTIAQGAKWTLSGDSFVNTLTLKDGGIIDATKATEFNVGTWENGGVKTGFTVSGTGNKLTLGEKTALSGTIRIDNGSELITPLETAFTAIRDASDVVIDGAKRLTIEGPKEPEGPNSGVATLTINDSFTLTTDAFNKFGGAYKNVALNLANATLKLDQSEQPIDIPTDVALGAITDKKNVNVNGMQLTISGNGQESSIGTINLGNGNQLGIFAARNNTIVNVEKLTGHGHVDVGEPGGAGAKMFINNLAMDGGRIFVDPLHGHSVLGVNELGTDNTLTTQIIAGDGALVTIGTTSETEARAALAKVEGAGSARSVVFMKKAITIGLGGSFYIDPEATDNNSSNYPVYVGTDGLLAVDQGAVGDSPVFGAPLVHFEGGKLAVVNAAPGTLTMVANSTATDTRPTPSSATLYGLAAEAVLTDNPFVSVAGVSDTAVTLEASASQEGMSTLASMGIQSMIRRADMVLAETIADRMAGEVQTGSNLWVDVRGERYERDNLDNGAGFKADIGYGAFGAELAPTETTTLGVAFQYGNGTVKGDVANVKNKTKDYGFALYGSAMLGDTGVKGIGEVAYTKSTNDITSSLALMNQDTDATMLSAGVKAQKSFDLGTFEVIPSLGVRVSHIKTDAMQAGNVQIEKQKQTIVQIPLALRVNAKATETASGWSVTPKFKVAFIPTVGDKSIEVFGVKQSVIDTSPVQGSFGVGFAKGNLTIDAAAHLGAGNKGTSAVGGKVGLTYRF
ncbi:MAG: autotransporter domain-containing protein [Sutterella sp.]|nr:autotransporter domain-containing protein [Sutterella sp.]